MMWSKDHRLLPLNRLFMQKNIVEEAISSRMSVRAFTDKNVDRESILQLLEVASRAPSGTNTQPWKVYVVQGLNI